MWGYYITLNLTGMILQAREASYYNGAWHLVAEAFFSSDTKKLLWQLFFQMMHHVLILSLQNLILAFMKPNKCSSLVYNIPKAMSMKDPRRCRAKKSFGARYGSKGSIRDSHRRKI